MKNKSFTLIEILVVIIIIGILASVVLFSTNDSTEKRKRLEVLTFSEGAKGKNLDSLISEWNFDGPTAVGSSATNADVKDSWGHNDGVVYGGPIIKGGEDCVVGKCLQFTGSNYTNTPSNSSFDLASEFSMSAWFYIDSYSTVSLIPLIGQSNNLRFWQYANNGVPACFVWEMYNDGTRRHYDISLSLIPLKEWTQITLIYGGGISKAYKDGKLFGTKTVGVVELPLSAESFYVGNTNYRGFLDEVRIYKKALSVSEIKQNYIAGLDSLYSNNVISKEEYNQRTLNLAQNEE